jgi:pimeloyl-ACP methyl ester carboxylesterase
MPDAQPEIAASFDELQRIATSPDAAIRLWTMNSQVDVTELARKINVPTLVLHCVGDRVAPIEEGRLMAKLIPDATFVELLGNNHVLLEGTPAFDQFLDEASRFLEAHNR